MPRLSCRINPARTSSLWLTTSASAGSSLRVGISVWLQRIRSSGINGTRRTKRSVGYRRDLFGFFFGSEDLNLFHERVHNLRLGDFAYHFPFFEDEADAFAPGNAQIGSASFARPIDLATHNRNMDIEVAVR